jgi:hypothetical protein
MPGNPKALQYRPVSAVERVKELTTTYSTRKSLFTKLLHYNDQGADYIFMYIFSR